MESQEFSTKEGVGIVAVILCVLWVFYVWNQPYYKLDPFSQWFKFAFTENPTNFVLWFLVPACVVIAIPKVLLHMQRRHEEEDD